MEIIDFLDRVDKKLLLFLNGQHGNAADVAMIFLTERFVWIPFYISLIAFLFYHLRSRTWLALVIIALLITTADQFASSIMKPWVGRLRPCHDPTINYLLHLAKGCGGQFGFISSHAANTFALAAFVSYTLSIPWLTFILYFWASLVSYSRIYLGAHYPGDILGGAFAGIFFGYLYYHFFCLMQKKLYTKNTKPSI